MFVYLKPSRQLAALLIVMHGTMVPLVGLLSTAWLFKLAILGLLVVSLYYYLNRYALLRASKAVIALKLVDVGNCELVMRDGTKFTCTVSGQSYVSARLTVLILQPLEHWAQRSVVILPDSTDADTFRRLRIILRWQREGA